MLKKMMCVLVLSVFCVLSQQAQAELVSEWKFDGDAKDNAGDNHGKLFGNPAWAVNRYGDQGKALSLDGVNDYIDCGNDARLQLTGNITIAMWIKASDPAARSVLIDTHYEALVNAQYHLEVNRNNLLFTRGDGIDVFDKVIWPNLKEDVWYHVVAVDDGTNLFLYVNGKSLGSTQKTITPTSKFKGLVIGKYGALSNQCCFNGFIDDLRIYNHALSSEEVKALYLKNPSPVPIAERGADATEEVTIQQVSEAPVIDGSLSDEIWKKARWYSDFYTFRKLQKQIAEPKTSFAIVHDSENLYIGVRADEPEPTKMKALVTKRDGSTWKDDSIEIFLDSEGEGVYHHQFVVNTKGVLYDSQVVRGGIIHKPEWNSDAKAAAKTGEDAWFLEVSIPFSCLSFSSEEPTHWRLNVTRSRFVTSERELFTFAPVKGDFHNLINFAPASIENINLTPFLVDLSLEKMKFFPQEGQMTGAVGFLIKNFSSLPRELDLKATLHMNGEEVSRFLPVKELSKESTRKCDITFPVPAEGEGILKVIVQDKKLKKIVCSRQFPVKVDYTPMKVEVLRPHYQNAIFSGQKLKDIELEITTVLAPKERKDYLFEFSLNSDRKILCSQSAGIRDEKMNISIPLPMLKTGEYLMKGALVHNPTGKTLANWQEVLRKLPAKKGEVRFDENMVCLIDNEPFLPFGLFNDSYSGPTRGSEAIREAIELGCNAIHQEHHWGSYLDELRQSGLKVLIIPRAQSIPQAIFTIKKGILDKPLTVKQKKSLRSVIRETKDFPLLLAWFIGNEPHPPSVRLDTMKQINSIISEEDPYHPTLIISCLIKDIEYYMEAMPLVIFNPYPYFLKDGGWHRPNYTTHFVEEAVRLSKGRKPVWVVMQACDFTFFGGVGQRAPNFADLRSQMYQAAIAGAKGFFWYCRPWIPSHGKIGLSYLAKEAQLLREAIFATESSQEFTIVNDAAGKSKSLHMSSRQVGKDSYFFAANGSNKERKITFNVRGLRDRKLFVVGEGRNVRVKSGEFTDFFKLYDTHIYTTDKSVARRLDITDVYKEIEANCTPIIKPGNLAHKNRGAVVRSSWVARGGKRSGHPLWYPPLDFVIDGIKGTSSWGDAKQLSWVEVTFPKPQEICKVVIDSNICHLQVEVEKNGMWLRVADVKANTHSRREAQTIKFQSEETRKLRVLALEVKGEVIGKKALQTQIWEIEVYGGK